jgi:hypothetical protein
MVGVPIMKLMLLLKAYVICHQEDMLGSFSSKKILHVPQNIITINK